MPSRRIMQINNLMRKEISDILRREINDPRLSSGFLAVTEVETSADLKNSTIYVSDVTGSLDRQKIMAALDKAGGYIHTALYPRLDLRVVPFLHFKWDSSIEQGVNISTKLDRILSVTSVEAENRET